MKRNGILILMAITLVMSACKKKGCTDPTANNYSTEAEKDDGTCAYDAVSEATTLDCNLFSQSGTSYDLVDKGLEVDYIVDCKMPVYCDLKIMPGVTIAFKTDAGLKVYAAGSINAVATTEGPILLTGFDKAAGSWAGIYVESTDVKNKFDGCKIEYAGGDDFNSNADKGAFILYARSSMEISNTHISNCAAYGINANYSGCSFVFNNNTITTCTKPMFVAAEYGGSISGGVFTGNAIDVIYIDTYGGQADILTDQTWTDLAVPYRMLGGAVVQSKCNWVIATGVTLEFEAGSGILVNSANSLKAVGTSADPVIFKGVNPGNSAWKNIKFVGTNSLNEIVYAIISGSGENSAVNKGCCYLATNAKLTIDNVMFNDNANCGVYGTLAGGQVANPNYTSSNLFFNNTTCTENFQ